MKATTLRMLVGVTTPLILTGSVQAGFLGISTASKPNQFGLLVVNVYAEFDRPGEDHMIAVAGTPGAPMLIQVIGGTFYNHVFGTDRPPSCALGQCGTFPSLLFDSFITMGVKSVGPNGQPFDPMVILPGFPGVSGTQLSIANSSGWAITPNEPAADPFNSDFFAGDGRILIGQFSTADGSAIQGTMLLQFISNNAVGQSVVSFYHVPGPGALWLFGATGLLGRRRRPRNAPTARKHPRVAELDVALAARRRGRDDNGGEVQASARVFTGTHPDCRR